MNDPHVVALLYRIEHDNTVKYDEALPIEHEEAAFHIKVADKQVRIELKEHYDTEDAGLTAVGGYIRSWELKAALDGRPGQFQLIYERPDIVDRNPSPPNPGVLSLSGTIQVGAITGRATLVATNPKPYPDPPSGMTLDPDNPDVATMYDRYMGYLGQREPLVSMAYFCLTMLEAYLCDGRKRAGETYAIHNKVLAKVGDLTANRGGRAAARKATGINSDLTPQERRFLEEAVRVMIRRVAEVAHDPHQSRAKITFPDLPLLSG